MTPERGPPTGRPSFSAGASRVFSPLPNQISGPLNYNFNELSNFEHPPRRSAAPRHADLIRRFAPFLQARKAMLKNAIKKLPTPLLGRAISRSAARPGGQLLVSSVLSSGVVPTVDHNMSVERAAQLMAERHVDAIPVTKNDRVIGLFTKRDYFEKVLNARHQATRSSMVSEVGLMGPELVVAKPSDTVEECLAVMTRKNLMALPVVEDDGHALGMVTVMDLTRQYLDEQMDRAQAIQFSEPTFFPENLILPDGGVHDEELGDPELFKQLAMDPTEALLEHTNPELEGRAAEQFCEGSLFPEFTPTEEIMLAEAHGEPPSAPMFTPYLEREERFMAAHSEVLGRMEAFSEPSDFPEAAPVDEAIQARA